MVWSPKARTKLPRALAEFALTFYFMLPKGDLLKMYCVNMLDLYGQQNVKVWPAPAAIQDSVRLCPNGSVSAGTVGPKSLRYNKSTSCLRHVWDITVASHRVQESRTNRNRMIYHVICNGGVDPHHVFGVLFWLYLVCCACEIAACFHSDLV